MIAAFLFVAAYLGFAHVGSQFMEPPAQPERALSTPDAGAAMTASVAAEVTVTARAEVPTRVSRIAAD